MISTRFFKDIETLEDLKKQYRTLALWQVCRQKR